MDHRFDDLSVHFTRTFIRLNVDFVMMYESTGHRYLKMICSQNDRSSFATEVWPSGACENWKTIKKIRVDGTCKQTELRPLLVKGCKRVINKIWFFEKDEIKAHLHLFHSQQHFNSSSTISQTYLAIPTAADQWLAAAVAIIQSDQELLQHQQPTDYQDHQPLELKSKYKNMR